MPILALMKRREHHTCGSGVHDICAGLCLNNDAFDIANGHFMYGRWVFIEDNAVVSKLHPVSQGKFLSEGNVLVDRKCSGEKASFVLTGEGVLFPVLDNNSEAFQCLRINLNSGGCITGRTGDRWGRGHG